MNGQRMTRARLRERPQIHWSSICIREWRVAGTSELVAFNPTYKMELFGRVLFSRLFCLEHIVKRKRNLAEYLAPLDY